MTILAGDVGGTKAHLALCKKGKEREWIAEEKYKSADFENLSFIIKEFLNKCDEKVEAACFGVAGPVQDNICKATNLPWVVDGNALGKELGIPKVALINDLLANAYGVQALEENELFILNEGKKSMGNKALISAGTGLGQAGLFFKEDDYFPFACEGGHCSFAPENDLEVHMLRHFKKQYDHVSFERVLSGMGLTNLYKFFVESGLEEKVPEVESAEDPARIITEKGLRRAAPACARALYCFVEIYGSEAGNLALKMLATGGLYIGGGIAPKILNALKEGGFMKRFINKGRFTSLLLGIPVKVILNENTALLGAARYGFRL